MTLEDIGAIETFLGSRARTRAESAHHGPFIMRQCMSVFVILPSEALLVVIASYNRTFFRPFRLMGKHVGLQVFEKPATVEIRTTASFLTIFIKSNAG